MAKKGPPKMGPRQVQYWKGPPRPPAPKGGKGKRLSGQKKGR